MNVYNFSNSDIQLVGGESYCMTKTLDAQTPLLLKHGMGQELTSSYIEGKNSFLCYRSVNYHELFLVKTSITEPIAKIKIFLTIWIL